MAKMKRKGDLPEKTCAACERPFAWRKKWKANWEEVRYCSDRCRGMRPKAEAVVQKAGDQISQRQSR